MDLFRVKIGSVEHIIPIILALVIAIIIIKRSRSKSTKIKERVTFLVSLFVSLVVIVFHLKKALLDNYSIQEDLPLYLCSLLAVIIPIHSYYRRFWMFEILVFWIIVGTLQGVITPDIEIGFPSFDYFRYWVVHLGLLVIIGCEIIVFKLRPKWQSVLKSFFAFQIYIALIFGLNKLLDSNYGYLNEKPKSASILDYLGDWPYYVFKADVILLVAFVVVFLIFKLSEIKLFSK
jgi:hypothetical integral membrane protein (TIGR02206 family)